MGDIRTYFFDAEQLADWAVSGGLLAEDDGLVTAVLMSLFTDRRALDDDIVPDATRNQRDPRGWWADEYSDPPADEIGSRLWLNESAKQLPIVLTQDREHAEEALAWLVDDQLVSAVAVETNNPREGVRVLSVTLTSPDGGAIRLQFQDFWERH
ncbi:phage GP46 family protein [Burkholderia cenocepacia]|uniref:phage GP46 family protein n=1 Tax=Burkholderia cenocepacia TaxID=95486 RepID=UPI001B9D34B1|nr:phage GP46 family protein [Burkholderia cenocepacia]MBR8137180.1 phage GP46 family protein [Burkholderia cenocepacia]